MGNKLAFVCRSDGMTGISCGNHKTRVSVKNLENCIIRQCASGNFGEFTENFNRSVSLLKKISKNFEKVLDKQKTT